jgi:hypothetical protein
MEDALEKFGSEKLEEANKKFDESFPALTNHAGAHLLERVEVSWEIGGEHPEGDKKRQKKIRKKT